MIRALATLVGFACAAALLLLVPDVGAAEGGDVWQRAALLAGAGLVAGALSRLGGIRRAGHHVNVSLLVAAFVPWTLLALALTAHRAGTPVWLADLAHDVVPDGALTRWSASFPILAFAAGLLLAFALVEPDAAPRTHTVRATEQTVVDAPAVVDDPPETVELRPV